MRREQVRASVVVAVVAVLALLVPSCGGNGDTGDAGGNPDVTSNPCGADNFKMCGATCVDTQNDFQNCGDCGKACPDNQVCSHGSCAVVCGGGTSRCGSSCVDLKADPQNCGGCGKACPSGQVCNQSNCALTCQSGLTNCSGGCVDITANDANCGTCGNACPLGKQCVASACVATCQPGWTSCGDGDGGTTCVDTTDDSNNCNGCGIKCPSGYFCNGGACGLNCAGGTSKCGTACVDEQLDANNCGGCGTTCPGGTPVCSGAHCCATATPYYCPAESKCDTIQNCVLKSGGAISLGQQHSCAINPSGALYCWGYGSNGELGNNTGTGANSAQPVTGLSSGVAAVATAYYGTCATTTGGADYCWGFGIYGQLGNSGTSSSNKPVAVTGLSSALVPGGGGYYGGNCAVLTTGAVDCWGWDEYGELGLGSITYSTYSTPQVSKVTSAIAIGGASLNFEGNLCAILSSGGVQCWGYNGYYLGDSSTTESGTPITVTGVSNAAQVASGSSDTCIVMKDGSMKCWGYNYYGQLGDGTTTTSYGLVSASISGIVQVGVGYDHTCVVTTGGAVKCIGLNNYGQLGNGSTSSSATTTWQTAIASGAISVACGGYHSCALLTSGKAQCWGQGTAGQLGQGSNSNSSSPVTVSGF